MAIDTARLTLRPVTVDDADVLERLDRDPLVMRYVSGGEPTSRHRIEQWTIPRSLAEQRRHGTGMWTVRDRTSDTFLGWVSLRVPRHSQCLELELTYRLARAAWGRGLAAEASAAVIDLGFGRVPADRVFATTLAENVASRRVMEKLGMRLSTMGLTDPVIDSGFTLGILEYELLRSMWSTSRRSAISA